jgi:hypothetical protein
MELWHGIQLGRTINSLTEASDNPALRHIALANRNERRLTLILSLAVIVLIVLGSILLPAVFSPSSPPAHQGIGRQMPRLGDQILPWLVSLQMMLPRLALSLFATLGFAFFWWRRRTRKAGLLRGLAPRDVSPLALRVSAKTPPLFSEGVSRSALREFRRHRTLQASTIDIDKTIASTVGAGGFASFVYSSQQVTPEYILLVDRATRDDHISLIADALVDRLHFEQIQVTRYDYLSDPRKLRLVQGNGLPSGVFDLEHLAGRRSNSILLMITDADRFWDSVTGRERRWVPLLRKWTAASILTLKPSAHWGPREAELSRLGFLIAEASPGGLNELAHRLATGATEPAVSTPTRYLYEIDRRLSVDPLLWLGDTAPDPNQICGLIRDLRSYLDEGGFILLGALAIFPVLRPKLTSLVGNALFDERGKLLLSEVRLGALARLPWFRKGRLPDWLRLALARELMKDSKAAERVRAAWTAILEPRPDGRVEEVLAVLPRFDRSVREIVIDLLRADSVPELHDAILLGFMTSAPLPELTVQLPKTLDRALRRHSSWSEVLAVVACLAFVAAIFFVPETSVRALQRIGAELSNPFYWQAAVALSSVSLTIWLVQAMFEISLAAAARLAAALATFVSLAIAVVAPSFQSLGIATAVLAEFALVCSVRRPSIPRAFGFNRCNRALRSVLNLAFGLLQLTSDASHVVSSAARSLYANGVGAQNVGEYLEKLLSESNEDIMSSKPARLTVYARLLLLNGTQTLIWMTAVLMVAFPSQILHFEITTFCREYLSDYLHSASLLFLIMIQLWQAAYMQNDYSRISSLTGLRLLTLSLATFLFLAIGCALPVFDKPLVDGHVVVVAFMSLICLGVVYTLAILPQAPMVFRLGQWNER